MDLSLDPSSLAPALPCLDIERDALTAGFILSLCFCIRYMHLPNYLTTYYQDLNMYYFGSGVDTETNFPVFVRPGDT